MEYSYVSKDTAMREKPPLHPPSLVLQSSSSLSQTTKPLSSCVNKNNILKSSFEINTEQEETIKKYHNSNTNRHNITMIEIPKKIINNNNNKSLSSTTATNNTIIKTNSSTDNKSVTTASTNRSVKTNNKSKSKTGLSLSQPHNDTKSRLEIMSDLECSNSR